MKVHVVSLGCARNQVDSETMLGRLMQGGGEIVQVPEEADVIVVNTCSFIESAADESIETILEMAEYKQHGNCRRLVVTGCLPERYREAIVPTLPEVDIFLGTGAYGRILEAIETSFGPEKCILPDPDLVPAYGLSPRVNSSPGLAYLKVAEGCNKKCTYCIIPKLRGHLKSRPLRDIVSEADWLVNEQHIKELILIAQDTTSYGIDFEPQPGFHSVLETLAKTYRDIWIRFLYGHPESLSGRVIETIARFDNLAPYFDIPIQHASNTVLKKMGRKYTSEDLVSLFGRIRAAIPQAALRTTVIVGFPGESEADFEALMTLIQEIKFNHLGAFTYSDAQDLPSHHLPGHVPRKVMEERLERLMTCQAGMSLKINQGYVGRTMTVLVEEAYEEDLSIGRAVFQAPEVDGIVYVKGKRLAVGSFVQVKITDATEYDLTGETK